MHRRFQYKDFTNRYTYLVIGRDKCNFLKIYYKSDKNYKEDEIVKMIEF